MIIIPILQEQTANKHVHFLRDIGTVSWKTNYILEVKENGKAIFPR